MPTDATRPVVTSRRSAAEPTPARPERSGRVFSCPFPSESCPAPGLEDRAKRTGRRAARSRIRGFRPETPGKRANLAELEALGHGNRAPDRRETAFCAAKSRQQRPEPVPVQLDPRRLRNEIRRTGLDPRAARRPRARPPITRSTRDGLLFVKSGCKHAGSSSRSSSSSSPAFTFCLSWCCENLIKSHTGPRRSISRRSSRHWFPGSDPPASIPEDSFQMPGSSSWHRDPRSGAPGYRVIFLAKTTICRQSQLAAPGLCRRVHGPCF